MSRADVPQSHEQPHKEWLALGVQQPWADLIVRGLKTIEVRSQPTQVRGRIYIYSSKRPSTMAAAAEALAECGLALTSLPLGRLVGSVEIVGCRSCEASDARASRVPAELLVGQYAWELSAPQQFAEPIPVRFLPYGVWFYPFQRRGATGRRR